jgi:hypothetical protein
VIGLTHGDLLLQSNRSVSRGALLSCHGEMWNIEHVYVYHTIAHVCEKKQPAKSDDVDDFQFHRDHHHHTKRSARAPP